MQPLTIQFGSVIWLSLIKGSNIEKSEKEVSIESKETDVNNLIKQAKDVAEPQTTPVEVKKAVMENTKDTVDVPAKYLDKANFPGPFTAGVNQVIPYHLFAGDGMLTRLILKSSDKAPWSDNGSAKNPALLPLEKLGKGLYFYEVDLAGTQGKQDKELLDFIKKLGDEPYIVVGDFNQGGVTVEEDILKDVAKELGKSNILTFPTGLDRIDYIFVSSNIEVIDYDVIIKDMSDHYPVFAKIKI